MSNPFPTSSAEAFFFERAGYSYNPETETAEAGRARCGMLILPNSPTKNPPGLCGFVTVAAPMSTNSGWARLSQAAEQIARCE